MKLSSHEKKTLNFPSLLRAAVCIIVVPLGMCLKGCCFLGSEGTAIILSFFFYLIYLRVSSSACFLLNPVLMVSFFLHILIGLYVQVLVMPFFVSAVNLLFLGATIVLSNSSTSSFEEVRAPVTFPHTPRELEEVSNPLFRGDPQEGSGASSLPSLSAPREEGPTEPSTELHPHSPGPAPLLVPGGEETDLLRAVAPFLKGEASESSIQVPDQTPLAGASLVLSNDERGTDGSPGSSDCESSSSSEVSVSEDESEVEFHPETAEVISIPQFRMASIEREQGILLKAQNLLSREGVDEEYVLDIQRNLLQTAELGEGQSQLNFEEFEVGLMEKKQVPLVSLFFLFSTDSDPGVLNYKAEHHTVADLTYHLNDDFRDFHQEITNCIETTYSHDQGFRERARDHVNFFLNDLRTHGHNSITYMQFREKAVPKE